MIHRVSNSLDPDQARHFVRPDLGPNCLQRSSAEKASLKAVDYSLTKGKITLFILMDCHIRRISNNLDPDQARRYVEPDLGPNCLQRSSAEKATLKAVDYSLTKGRITLFILVAYLIHIRKISTKLSILTFKGLPGKISIKCSDFFTCKSCIFYS